MNEEYKIFKALSDPTRYKIIKKVLETKNNCCTDIATFTDKDISTISRQLDILEEYRIIEIKRVNKTKCIKVKKEDLVKKLIETSKNIYEK